jgi:hypothetical protein
MSCLLEPSITELLSEPIVLMVMVQDGVTASELRSVLEEARADGSQGTMSPALLPFGDPATSCHTALTVGDPSIGSRPKLSLAA